MSEVSRESNLRAAEFKEGTDVSGESIDRVLSISDRNYYLTIYRALGKYADQSTVREAQENLIKESGLDFEGYLEYFKKESFPTLNNYCEIEVENPPSGDHFFDVSQNSILIYENSSSHPRLSHFDPIKSTFSVARQPYSSPVVFEDVKCIRDNHYLASGENMIALFWNMSNGRPDANKYKTESEVLSIDSLNIDSKVVAITKKGLEVIKINRKEGNFPYYWLEKEFEFDYPQIDTSELTSVDCEIQLGPNIAVCNFDKHIVVQELTEGKKPDILLSENPINHFQLMSDSSIYTAGRKKLSRWICSANGWVEKDASPKGLEGFIDLGREIEKFRILENRMFLLAGLHLLIYDIDEKGKTSLAQDIKMQKMISGKMSDVAIIDFDLFPDGKIVLFSSKRVKVFDGEKKNG